MNINPSKQPLSLEELTHFDPNQPRDSHGRWTGSGYSGGAHGRANLLKERTIPKGTVMYRTTATKGESLSGPKYVTYVDSDRDTYRGGWTWAIRKNAGKSEKAPIYEIKFKTKEDLRIPSREEVRKTMTVVLKDKTLRKEAAKSYTDMMLGYDYQDIQPGSSIGNLKITDAEYKRLAAQGKYIFKQNKASLGGIGFANGEMIISGKTERFRLSTASLGKAPNVKRALINELQKKGFNAIADEAGIGGGRWGSREGIDPLIIFDGGASLSTSGISRISAQVEKQALNRVMDDSDRLGRSRARQWSAICEQPLTLEELAHFDPNQPRDDHGRWSSRGD